MAANADTDGGGVHTTGGPVCPVSVSATVDTAANRLLARRVSLTSDDRLGGDSVIARALISTEFP
jgi:hypothetical protein